ncbi:hybrid sensor histidine kinase/response regulator [Dyadobacter luticola]|nr:two-component regulator propeller domain-containing protein [Dyadobacter luticola]
MLRFLQESRFLHLLFLSLYGLTIASAQNRTLQLAPLSGSENFSQNSIHCILQDSYGFMWFGTQDGLNKYNGYGIQVFKNNKNEPTSLSANHITSICEDLDGNLWIGTRTGGLNKYDRAKDHFTRFVNKEGDPHSINGNQINVVCKDSQSNIWVGTPSGLNFLKRNARSFQNIPLGPLDQPEEVRAIFEDSRQNIWIGTNRGLILRKKNATSLQYYRDHDLKNQDNSVLSISEDDGGNIWIGCAGGLKLLDKKTGTFRQYAVEPDKNSVGGINPIICLLKTRNNQFWLGSNTTLQLFDATDKKLVQLNDRTDGESRMPNDGIYSLFEDKSGVLWIGTSSQGILKYDPNLTTFESYKSSLANIPSAKNIVRALAEDKAGNIYLATDAGFEYFDRTRLTYKKYTHQQGNLNSLSSNYTTSLVYSKKNGQLWIGTSGNGLDLFNPGTGTFKHFTKGPGAKSINNNSIDILIEDRAGRIWIGTDGGGVNLYDPASGNFVKYLHQEENPSNSLCDNTVLALHEDRKGNIWIGGYSKGISIFDPVRNTFSQLNTANSTLTSDVVACFYEDSKGDMWIGTQGGGLNRYNPKNGAITSFTEENGLVNNSVNYISEDKSGILWISTNHGITSFDPIRGTFKNFGKNNNLKTTEFNLGAGIRLASGEIAMGNINGFTIVDPAQLTYNSNKPNIVLTGLQLFNKPVNLKTRNGPLKQTLLTSKEIVLDHSHSVFTVSFAALDYTNPQDNQYAYKLEGFDADWNYIGNAHNASYTNLNPGTYTLRIRGSNNDGLWSDKEASLVIRIKSPYWMTWWFKSALVLFFVAGAYLFYYYRLKFERKQKAMLALQVRRRTEEIRDQAYNLQKLNRELMQNTATLEELNDRLLEQKAQERNARLIAESAQKQADAANSAKSTFLATMSHELRTPINGVMGMASLLTETNLDNEQKEYAEAILNSGQSLLSVINDVLDFSKIESGNIELEAHRFELRSCIEDVLELFGPKIVESGIDLLYLIEDNVPAFVFGDSFRLRQILINMVGNAVKFTHHGEVLIKIMLGEVSDNKFKLRFEISDTGIGIPAEQQGNLFKAFNQLDSSVTRKYGGSGLGLVICERLVKLMGGQIEVQSEFGHGTSFHFEIDCENIETQEPNLKAPENLFFNDKLALIVDDNENSRAILKSQVSSLKINVIAVGSGTEALEILSGEARVDLVIADMQMPGMDGLQLSKKIRETTSAMPIILLGSLRDENQRNSQSLFSSIISKPVRQAQLFRSITNLLKTQEAPKPEQRKTALSTEFAGQYPYNILIAEDILLNQKLIIWILNKLGYQPDLANNGLEVIEMMKLNTYDLILMDLQMPEMDGLEATRIIRQTYGSRPLIVALTANAMSEDRTKCIAAGMNDYMSKPINLEVLTKCLTNLYNQQISAS